MDKQNEELELQAERLAEEALHELGDVPPDEVDDYATQCDYAGCYPWLSEVICAHPRDNTILPALRGSDADAEEWDGLSW